MGPIGNRPRCFNKFKAQLATTLETRLLPAGFRKYGVRKELQQIYR